MMAVRRAGGFPRLNRPTAQPIADSSIVTEAAQAPSVQVDDVEFDEEGRRILKAPLAPPPRPQPTILPRAPVSRPPQPPPPAAAQNPPRPAMPRPPFLRPPMVTPRATVSAPARPAIPRPTPPKPPRPVVKTLTPDDIPFD